MNFNEYNEVVNGPATYSKIATLLRNGQKVLIGWTDNEYTHYDLLFVYKNIQNLNRNFTNESTIQRGLNERDLFVGIIGRGCYGFGIESPKSSGYIAEKLFNDRNDSSVEKITDLINGIIKEI